ncbi:MAG: hypothetical protein ACOCP2_01225 [Halohasta sp.]
MESEPRDERNVFSEGYAVPISGLLAVLFALMAGMSVYPALSGDPGAVVLPLIFGAASLYSIRKRKQYLTAREGER